MAPVILANGSILGMDAASLRNSKGGRRGRGLRRHAASRGRASVRKAACAAMACALASRRSVASEHLPFEQRDEERVGVLRHSRGRDASRIDLVQDRDLRVVVRDVGIRVGLEVLERGFNRRFRFDAAGRWRSGRSPTCRLGVRCGHTASGCARSPRREAGEAGAVGLQRLGRLRERVTAFTPVVADRIHGAVRPYAGTDKWPTAWRASGSAPPN